MRQESKSRSRTDCLHAVVYLEGFVCVRKVKVDRSFRNKEDVGDLLASMAGSNEPKDLKFSDSKANATKRAHLRLLRSRQHRCLH